MNNRELIEKIIFLVGDYLDDYSMTKAEVERVYNKILSTDEFKVDKLIEYVDSCLSGNL